MLETASDSAEKKGLSKSAMPIVKLAEHIVEIVSDSGEGAQRCGQSFASIAARSGNGIWTGEIIPAEIQPPARSTEGTSGNRIRVSSNPVTNGGDEADLVIAFNEQVLLCRINANEIKLGSIILLENKWAAHPDTNIATAYAETLDHLHSDGYNILEIPMEVECLKHVPDAKRGKNMFVLGMLCSIYSLDIELGRQQVARIFAKKSDTIINANQILLEAGRDWAADNLDIKYQIPAVKKNTPQIIVNGNTALSLGVLASGMQICAMYPITPATSASHYLSEVFKKVGGLVHQAEDEIAACAFAVGASYAGKCAVTITSGPGYSLKQEAIGLAVMGEIPMVVVNVQRGGPSTGQPTKVEQGDLLTACFGSHGDAPKVVMAAANIEDCFYSMITARQLAETFNMVVVVLTDANLATAQQPIPRPEFSEEWLAPPVDQSAVPKDAKPYDWDPKTGLAPRFVPGRPDGMHCLTGLAHDQNSKVIYDPEINEQAIEKRSLKLAALQKTLKPPPIFGGDQGDLLIIGWGSTKGAIEEAIERVRADGFKASSVHLQFLQPLASGLKEIMDNFEKVVIVENSWSDKLEDEMIDENNRRFSNLAWLIRGRYLVDADCWSEVKGRPSKPGAIEQMIRDQLQ